MEVHLVHTDDLGNNVVVSELLAIGDHPNELITEIFENAPAEEGTGFENNNRPVRPSNGRTILVGR